MMRTWSFYDPQTGELHPRQYSAPNERSLSRNTPSGLVSIEGSFDYLTQRVAIENPIRTEVDGEARLKFEVVTWINLKALDAREQRDRASGTKARIAELEAKQLRSIREDMLRPNERGSDGKLPRERLLEIDDEISALRSQLAS